MKAKYENSLEIYRDLKGVINTVFDEGRLEIAQALRASGVALEIIAPATGLTEQQLDAL